MDSSTAWSDPRFPYKIKTGKRHNVFMVQECEASIFKSPHDPCYDCEDSFYTDAEQEEQYPKFAYLGEVSRDEATRIATEYTQNAQRDRDALSKLLLDYGDLVVSRWKKKNPAKRAAILTAASPELNQDDWVFSLYYKLNECWEAAREPVARTQLLLPWLTLSILKANPSALFALLHHRTTFAPHEWAPYDNKQLALSWSVAHFDLQFTALCVVMHGTAYGKIVNFDLDAIHRQDVVGFPRARLILEAQAYLMKFLRNTVEIILATVDQPVGSENWLTVSRAGLRHVGGELGYRSTYAHQAYSRPPVLEPSRLLSICEVQMNALEDHLSFLQTDPTYMKHHVQIIQQGKLYELVRNDQKGSMLYDALFKEVVTYWRWKWLKAECEHVKSLQDRFRDSICPGQPLPAKYEKALGALELFLANLVNWRAEDLRLQVAQRPGFSSYFTYTPMDGGTRYDTMFNSQRDWTEIRVEDPLLWCLIQLTGDMRSQRYYDHGHLFAFLEQHLLTCSAQDRKRVDSEILKTVSDLVAYFEMLMNVRLHRPLYRARELSETMTAEDRGAWKDWSAVMEIHSQYTYGKRKVIGNKLFDKMTSSSPHSLDKIMRMEQVKSTRACLESFWGETRKMVKIGFQDTRFTAAEIASLTEVISAHRTPEYLNEVRLEESRFLETPKPDSQQGFELRTEWDLRHTEAKNSSTTTTNQKIKTKTRSIGPSLPEAHEVPAAAPEVLSPQKIIPVSKRSLQVLRLMYPAEAEERAKGVDWATFVRTMADTGFVASEGAGSAVSFENQEGGRIIFHRPHPDSDVDAHLLRSIAWRMRKWFGWGRERFVLKA